MVFKKNIVILYQLNVQFQPIQRCLIHTTTATPDTLLMIRFRTSVG